MTKIEAAANARRTAYTPEAMAKKVATRKANAIKKKQLPGVQQLSTTEQIVVDKCNKDGIVTVGRKCINKKSKGILPYKPKNQPSKHRWNIVIYESNVLKAVRILHEYGIEVSLELYNGK